MAQVIVSLILLWILGRWDKPTKRRGKRKPNYQTYTMKNNLMNMFK